tara:strand:+ start:56 stop:274 length:219 start_codon:yes stop_codon:yes gene_type:complete
MPGMRERKLHMMGETKSSRGDYGVEGHKFGGKVKGYKFGGKVKVGTGSGYMDMISAPIASATQAKKKKLRRR